MLFPLVNCYHRKNTLSSICKKKFIFESTFLKAFWIEQAIKPELAVVRHISKSLSRALPQTNRETCKPITLLHWRASGTLDVHMCCRNITCGENSVLNLTVFFSQIWWWFYTCSISYLVTGDRRPCSHSGHFPLTSHSGWETSKLTLNIVL